MILKAELACKREYEAIREAHREKSKCEQEEREQRDREREERKQAIERQVRKREVERRNREYLDKYWADCWAEQRDEDERFEAWFKGNAIPKTENARKRADKGLVSISPTASAVELSGTATPETLVLWQNPDCRPS